MLLHKRISYQEAGEEPIEEGNKTSLDVFLEDDKEKENEEKPEDKEEEEETVDDEGKPIDKKEKEEEIKEDEILTRVDFKDIKAEFPEFFKKFPSLKEAFFREQKFTELFATVEEAKEAADAQTAYNEITDAVLAGDASKFISELTKESTEGLKKFSEAFLPSLFSADKNTYLDVVTPIVSQFVKNAYAHGKKNNDTNIQNAAKIIHKVLFEGDYDDVERETTGLLNREKSDAEKKLDEERNKHLQEKYTTLYQDVSKNCYSALENEILKGLTDVKDRPGLQKRAAKNIKDEVLAEMEKDEAYVGRINGLWKKEQRNGFSGTSKKSFETTFMAKAKTLIPKIRKAVREDLIGKEIPKEDDKVEKNRPDAGNRSDGSKGKMTPERARKEGLSTKQVFDAD